ncbi:Endonuclease, Uma2 family (restriction endonuclease fold) [Methylobacterium sp. 174MFSha1.1]|uniref:Uma2 family endonuclease n=1 Tax=Methylobacterium sp. 174MFSha1.1 TaxID=1502749 RepID=UPI0008EF5CCA|nr:Uma2 family endonuclease [Methylobacterium sp. 174MFSha1.1]SFV16683.1 Endonuclease, Uma2 family (restriction endonuclease fold) [Methylobacterium sp. 174MFSha1.1]
MLEPAPRHWSVQKFFAWHERQDERYELVGGVPVRLRISARNVHDDIVVNLVAEFRTRLRGTPCRPFTGDGSVETLPGQIRRPDLGIDCGARDPNGLTAAEPRLVVEVLSPSTRDFDAFDKLEEYKAVASLAVILLVEPNAPEIALWRRDADGAWQRRLVAGLEQAIELPEFGMTLALADVYDGVAFPPRPRLVSGT